jgi:hypothetical protein
MAEESGVGVSRVQARGFNRLSGDYWDLSN